MLFHIHQLHFVQLESNGDSVSRQGQRLMDEIIIPPWDGFEDYPSVKVRLDFRDPTTEGRFVYHCHILGHAKIWE